MEMWKISSPPKPPLQRLISPKGSGGQGTEQEAQGWPLPCLWPLAKGRINGAPRNSSLAFIRLNSHSNNCKVNTGDETWGALPALEKHRQPTAPTDLVKFSGCRCLIAKLASSLGSATVISLGKWMHSLTSCYRLHTPVILFSSKCFPLKLLTWINTLASARHLSDLSHIS